MKIEYLRRVCPDITILEFEALMSLGFTEPHFPYTVGDIVDGYRAGYAAAQRDALARRPKPKAAS